MDLNKEILLERDKYERLMIQVFTMYARTVNRLLTIGQRCEDFGLDQRPQ